MDDSSCLFIVPSPMTSCSASMSSRIEMMTSEQFMSALSSFQLVSNAETATCGTQVDSLLQRGYYQDCGAQTENKKLTNVGTGVPHPYTSNVGTDPRPVATTDAATQDEVAKNDASTQSGEIREDGIAEKTEIGVNTENKEFKSIGINTTNRSGVALPMPRQKTIDGAARVAKDWRKLLEPRLQNGHIPKRRTSADKNESKSKEKTCAEMEYIATHLKNLKNLLQVISSDIPSQVISFTQKYLGHIDFIVKQFTSEKVDDVISTDRTWMEDFQSNPLWRLTTEKKEMKSQDFNNKNYSPISELSDGEIDENEDKQKWKNKWDQRPTGVACPNIRRSSSIESDRRSSAKSRRMMFEKEKMRSVVRPRPKSPHRPSRTPPRQYRTPPRQYHQRSFPPFRTTTPPDDRRSPSPPRVPRGHYQLKLSPRQPDDGPSTPVRDEIPSVYSRLGHRNQNRIKRKHSNEENSRFPARRLSNEFVKSVNPKQRRFSKEEIEKISMISTVQITKREDNYSNDYRGHFPSSDNFSPQPTYPPNYYMSQFHRR